MCVTEEKVVECPVEIIPRQQCHAREQFTKERDVFELRIKRWTKIKYEIFYSSRMMHDGH